MANKDIFGLPDKKKKLNATASSMASEYGEELAGRKIADIADHAGKSVAKSVANSVAKAGAKPSEERLMAKVKKYDPATPSIRGDMFGVTRLPAGPEKTVELTPASEEDVFGTPKKKKEE